MAYLNFMMSMYFHPPEALKILDVAYFEMEKSKWYDIHVCKDPQSIVLT